MPRGKSTSTSPFVFARAECSMRAPGDKYPTHVPAGSAWYRDCPLVQAHPAEFSDEPAVIYPRGWVPPVEQATAAPGELREAGRGGE